MRLIMLEWTLKNAGKLVAWWWLLTCLSIWIPKKKTDTLKSATAKNFSVHKLMFLEVHSKLYYFMENKKKKTKARWRQRKTKIWHQIFRNDAFSLFAYLFISHTFPLSFPSNVFLPVAYAMHKSIEYVYMNA